MQIIIKIKVIPIYLGEKCWFSYILQPNPKLEEAIYIYLGKLFV